MVFVHYRNTKLFPTKDHQQMLWLCFSMDFMSDFDMMLQRKKSMSGKRRRNRDGGTFISDADDVVSAMIVKMNEAAEVSFPGSKDTLKFSSLLWANLVIKKIQKSGLYSAGVICTLWKASSVYITT